MKHLHPSLFLPRITSIRFTDYSSLIRELISIMGRSIDPNICFMNISECLLEVIEKTSTEDFIKSYMDVYGNDDFEGNAEAIAAENGYGGMFDVLGIELDNIEVSLVDEIEALDEFTFSNGGFAPMEGEQEPSVCIDEMIEREVARICQGGFMEESVSNLTVTVSPNNNLEVSGCRRRKIQYTGEPSSDDEGESPSKKKARYNDISANRGANRDLDMIQFLGAFLQLSMVREITPTATLHYPAGQNIYYVNPPRH